MAFTTPAFVPMNPPPPIQPPRPWPASDGTDIPLSEFIQDILPKRNDTHDPPPFQHGSAADPPTLRVGVPNTILLFPGSFNPPHHGHMKLLKQVMEGVGKDLNVIGAIIIIDDDEKLAEKAKSGDLKLKFSQRHRARLWHGDRRPPVDWVWIFSHPETKWWKFRSDLAEKAKKDKYDIRFIHLVGPTQITADSLPDTKTWSCDYMITSDTDYKPGQMGVLDVPSDKAYECSPWIRAGSVNNDIHQLACAKFNVDPTVATPYAFLQYIHNESQRIGATALSNWVCERREYPFGTIRYVPAVSTDEKRRIQSEQVRKLIVDTDVSKFLHIYPALAAAVPEPRLMLLFVRDLRAMENPHLYFTIFPPTPRTPGNSSKKPAKKSPDGAPKKPLGGYDGSEDPHI